ncbi:hypothetical protein [Streptomyces sp. GS7]|uniref:hypothetical protein n=1 Tax=Streptomyces sp. GS7 TaxID=2692234 RepID=UPI00131772E3|nr:hypothetical protein [Streptomyces sp. GS7]QHC24622.1 hypothetical protein GR130_27890 [Streptomyces sp. GS7]
MPDYLRKAFVQAVPKRMSKRTGVLLRGHLRLLVYSSRSTDSLLDVEEAFAELRSHWAAEGGNTGDLLKLVRMVSYRAQTLHTPVASEPAEEASPAALAQFWASSGHDIDELSTFMADVDQEAADWLPG